MTAKEKLFTSFSFYHILPEITIKRPAIFFEFCRIWKGFRLAKNQPHLRKNPQMRLWVVSYPFVSQTHGKFSRYPAATPSPADRQISRMG